jgi:uncharacterized cupredoxin-like copper-binding protein
VIIKTDVKSDSLPVDDSEVNEDDPRLEHIDELEDLTQGIQTSFVTKLEPGHYAFICNLPEHYQLGMHVDFTVR